MACALPVVAFPKGAIGDMVEDGKGGIIMKKRDADTLVAGIREVLADETRRREMGQFNRDKSHSQYAYPSVAEMWAGLYDEIIGR